MVPNIGIDTRQKERTTGHSTHKKKKQIQKQNKRGGPYGREGSKQRTNRLTDNNNNFKRMVGKGYLGSTA